jgi:hypothetical protein
VNSRRNLQLDSRQRQQEKKPAAKQQTNARGGEPAARQPTEATGEETWILTADRSIRRRSLLDRRQATEEETCSKTVDSESRRRRNLQLRQQKVSSCCFCLILCCLKIRTRKKDRSRNLLHLDSRQT